MKAKPLLFWTLVALVAHLSLFVLWPSLRTPGTGISPLPVQLVTRPPAPEMKAPSPPPPSAPAAAPAAPPRVAPAPAPPPRSVLGTGRPASSPEAAPPPAQEPGTASAAAPAAVEEAVPDGPKPVSIPSPVAGGERPEAEAPLVLAHPLYAENPPPPYPRLAAERGWEGEVLLRVQVSVSGEVTGVQVEKSSGYPLLDRAARDAVATWRFVPGRRGVVPVSSEVVVPVIFHLQRS